MKQKGLLSANKRINYFLSFLFLILKIIDVIITAVALPLGAIELHPFGFNIPSLIFTFSVVIILFIGNIITDYKPTLYLILVAQIYFNISVLIGIINNINVLMIIK